MFTLSINRGRKTEADRKERAEQRSKRIQITYILQSTNKTLATNPQSFETRNTCKTNVGGYSGNSRPSKPAGCS